MAKSYDDGFADGLRWGLRWCANTLRRAAECVEFPTYSEFERKSGDVGPYGQTYRAIARSGQPHFAAQLRSVADEIEHAAKTMKAPKDDPTPGTPPPHR